ncbi:CBO0543 family protein [Pseudalkalibacillus sp. A8]|uniref:CBO0543 family protein n=1 Tax=Pseudalkalibacillus sp. A8 TaxID=3382641 RepID=UPI0038B48BD3
MTVKEGIKQTESAYEQLIEVNNLISEAVVNAFMFTWQWWFGIGLFIIPWIFWFLFRDKESTGRLLIGGFVTINLSLIIDLIALSYGLWSYPMKFLPIAPLLFLPYHFSLTPVAIMFVLQIKPRAKPLLKGLIFAAIAAFGGMNFFAMIDFYNPKGWSTIYDFFIFLSIFFVANWFSNMDSFKKITDRS